MDVLTPLRERVPTLPASPRLPADAGGVTWRPARVDDLDALQALFRTIDASDHPEHHSDQDVHDALTATFVDLDVDSAVAERDGDVVAAGLVLMPDGWETHVQVYLLGGVHPAERGRGIGRRLASWQRERALERLAAVSDRLPARIVADADSRVPGLASLFARLGFAPDRSWSYLVHSLANLEPPQIATGLRIVDFDERFNEPLRHVKNAVFVADHWGSQPESEERWSHHVLVPSLRRDLSRLAVDADDRIAGFIVVTVYPDQPAGRRSAYIALVGVDRDFRGRGVAQAIVVDALARCAADGIVQVGLDVDQTSPTGADRLYMKLGFEQGHTTLSYVLAY